MSKTVPHYTIQKPIGKGAFAIVYLASHQITKEQVAIKQINIEGADGQMMDLFRKEIKIMSQVKHHNILQLKEAHYAVDTISMILEYCSQGDLERFIKKNAVKNRLPEQEARHIVLQIIDGIRVLHLNNIVHRDLKLANILINEQMQIKLADFGFAKLMDDQLMESYCGTPITMAPEILKKQDTYDSKCDIWSLGVMIYQIVFGNPPFVPQRGTIQDLLQAIATQKLQFPQHIPVTADLKDLLKRMLVEDPKFRMDFNQLFAHAWVKDVMNQSVLQCRVAQHKELISNIGFTINHKQNHLNKVIQFAQSMNITHPYIEDLLSQFINQLQSAFSTFKVHVYYSNKNSIVTYGKQYVRFDLTQSIVQLLSNVYEYGVHHQKCRLLDVFDILKLNQQIDNVFTIQYDQYSITLIDELQHVKFNQPGNLLQEIDNTPQECEDLQILNQMAIDRYV